MKRKEVMQKQAEKIHMMLEKEKNNYEKLLQNKSQLQNEKEELNHFVLENQVRLVGKANLKESSVNLNRLNA
jgi:hypothetical protein